MLSFFIIYFILSSHFGIESFSVLRLNYVRTFTRVDFYVMLNVLPCIFEYVNLHRFDCCLMVQLWDSDFLKTNANIETVQFCVIRE